MPYSTIKLLTDDPSRKTIYQEFTDNNYGDDDEYDHILLILQNYLEDTISVTTAAQRLGSLENLSSVLVWAARDLADAHGHLVELVVAISKQLDSESRDGFLKSLENELGEELWDKCGLNSSMGPDSDIIAEISNLDQWAALLLLRFPDNNYALFAYYSLHGMHARLREHRCRDPVTNVMVCVGALEDTVALAAPWIFSVGPELYESESNLRPDWRSGLICRQCWAGWKGAFERALNDECLNDATKKVAGAAVKEMDKIQGSSSSSIPELEDEQQRGFATGHLLQLPRIQVYTSSSSSTLGR